MSQKTILVVDDDADVRMLLTHRLESHGYRVLQAEDGIQAMDTAMTHGPDLIIADIAMPILDGFQLVETLVNQPYTKHIPCLFLTGRTDVADRVKGLRLGAHDYMTKPFEFDELLARVEGILERTDVAKHFDGVMRVGGRLEDVPLSDVLQTLELNRRTGVLLLLKPPENAEIDLYEGRITFAQVGELEGAEAFYELLPWDAGVFEFQDQPPRSRTPLARTNLELIMEGMRRLDESTREQ